MAISVPIVWTGLAVFSLAFLYFVIIRPARLSQAHVKCDDSKVTLVSGGNTTMIDVSEILEIKYHYSAVGGYFGVWELLGEKGSSIEIPRDAKGIEHLLPFLESSLEGFAIENFDRKYEAGDVEDTIDVWKRGATMTDGPKAL